MNKYFHCFLISTSLLLFSCSDSSNRDYYHKLSAEQHFDVLAQNEAVFSHNNMVDTMVCIGKIIAQFEEEQYTGIHCKGPYNYLEFERIYYALKKDTADINEISEIRFPNNYYGYCRGTIPSPEACIQFSFGYPRNSGEIENAPVLTLKNMNYSSIQLLDSMEIGDNTFRNVFKYQPNNIDFEGIGTIQNIYVTRQTGVARIETTDNYTWDRIK